MPLRSARNLALATALALGGCSGAAPTGSVVPQHPTVASIEPSTFVPVTFHIGVLKASAHPSKTGGSVAWFSPATRSVSLESVGNNQRKSIKAFNVGAGAKHCTGATNGKVCDIVLHVPASILNFEVHAFDKPLTPKGTVAGNLLAYAPVAFSSRTGRVAFAVYAVWRKMSLVSVNTSPVNGRPSNLGLKLAIKDVDGYTAYGRLSDSISAAFTTNPPNIFNAFTFRVNGKSIGSITTSSDHYQLLYAGRGIFSGVVELTAPRGNRIKIAVTPKASSFPISSSPALSSTSRVFVPTSSSEWFTEPSGHVGEISNGVFTETVLPSGHAVTMLGGNSEGAYYSLAFGTAQNTVGYLLPNLQESPVVSGSAIVGVSLGVTGPVYAQSNGAISEYTVGSSSPTLLVQVPNSPTLVDFFYGPQYYSPWIFTDTANNATGQVEESRNGSTFTAVEQPLPAGSGTPAFSALGPGNAIWTAIQGQPKVVIGSSVVSTAAAITSIASLGSSLAAVTDANGNIEMLDPTGKLLLTYTPPDGKATSIVEGHDSDFFYVCATCAHGLHDFLY